MRKNGVDASHFLHVRYNIIAYIFDSSSNTSIQRAILITDQLHDDDAADPSSRVPVLKLELTNASQVT